MTWRLCLLAVALALGGLAPLPTPLDALLNDPGAARAFDYPSLREGRDQDALSALNTSVQAAVAARTQARASKCQTVAEALVLRGVWGAFNPDTKAWRAGWTEGMTELDRLTAEMKTSLTAPLDQLPPTDSAAIHRRLARDARDPRLRELHERVARDQAVREQYMRLGPLSADARQVVLMVIGGEMCPIDHDNTEWLKAQIRAHGWFAEARDGANASAAAWLLVQHADRDPAFQREILPLLAKATSPEGRKNYAYLADRVAVNGDRPQIYGTQGRCKETGDWEPLETIDPAELDARRASVDLPPLADYRLANKVLCP